MAYATRTSAGIAALIARELATSGGGWSWRAGMRRSADGLAGRPGRRYRGPTGPMRMIGRKARVVRVHEYRMAMYWPDGYGSQIQQLAREIAGPTNAISRSLQPAIEAWRKEIERLPPVQDLVATAQRAAESAQRAFRRSLPPNWSDLEVSHWKDAMNLGVDHGLNVLWAPRREIIIELMHANDASARGRILEDREADILDDVDGVLSGAIHPELEHLPDLAQKAVKAQRAGHHEAGQALGAAVVTGVVQLILGYDKLADARKRFRSEHPMESDWNLFSVQTILHTVGRALYQTDVAPPGFNRHGSLHALPGQYSRVNATTAMLLVAGVLGELQNALTERDVERVSDAEAA